MKPRVYMTNRFYPSALERIEEYCDVEFHAGDDNPSHEEILARIADKDGLICLIADRIGKEVMDAGRNLRVICTASAGYNHIDVEEATQRGIYVCNTPKGPTEATADLAFAILLCAGRRLAEGDRFVRAGKWKSASPMFFGTPVSGKTLGIIGLGQIGKAVAKRSRGFGMKILYTDTTPASAHVERKLGARFCPLEVLLKESDFVTIHTPLTETTYHLINEERLALMKPTAILINTSRGAMVDETALAGALRDGRIAGAGLDVFEKEPTDIDNPLLKLENVVLLPHMGTSTEEAKIRMALMAVENLLSILKGKRPEAGWLNPVAGAKRSFAAIKMIR